MGGKWDGGCGTFGVDVGGLEDGRRLEAEWAEHE